MKHHFIAIDCSSISDWPSFHDVFANAFGFPDFYGRNLDAWMDCMSSLDEEFSRFRVAPGDIVALQLDGVADLRKRQPKIWLTLLEMVAFVNWRRLEQGEAAILTLAANC